MLDLTQVAKQLPAVGAHLSQEAQTSQLRLQLAQSHLLQATSQQATLTDQQHQWRDRLRFGAAAPLEPLDTARDIRPPAAAHTVLATDGSQIAPSHHEIAYCYLINVGRVMIHYGQSKHPLLDSMPEVFYRAADLYQSRRWGIDTEEWLGHRRTVLEAMILGELGYNWVAPPFDLPEDDNLTPPEHQPTVPALAMVDGSLLYRGAWEQLRSVQIPMVSYLSASRSSDSLNFLRLLSCSLPEPDCFTHCSDLERTPCQVFDGLRDTSLWQTHLQPGQRSALWASRAKVVNYYLPTQQIYFCYLHVGTEIARIEMPAWVAEDGEMLDRALGMVLAQVQKGQGYPVALAEAHNYAVVRGADRASFFMLLEREMVKAGIKNVAVSYKERRKRTSIA
jgi:hypothetical protein